MKKGNSIQLSISDLQVEELGGIMALNRKFVTVEGTWADPLSGQQDPPVFQVDTLSLSNEQEMEFEYGDSSFAVRGSNPWISIMCKFSDVGAEPKDLAYFKGMYSSVFPGLDHYWREQSYDLTNVAGSDAVGWYTLPQPKSFYVYDVNGDGHPDLNHQRLANDCTGVADVDVNFATYQNGGINMMFNDIFDSYNNFAWGGGVA
ncbi:MAG: hypothetical protein ABIG43_05120, partial [Chloroflexota bacterium]